MSNLKRKAVLASLASVITAIGLLFGAIDNANADLAPSNFAL